MSKKKKPSTVQVQNINIGGTLVPVPIPKSQADTDTETLTEKEVLFMNWLTIILFILTIAVCGVVIYEQIMLSIRLGL
ncbi:hypothetical protein [Bacillus wiedmannii]|uniref:hypothetical protein n=1 Tax=Bacillus wiedmannii TaxID=1890302 RepID=UPI003D2245B5